MRTEHLNELLRTQQVEKSTLLAELHAYLPQIVTRFYEALPLPALSFEPERGRRRLGSYCYEDGLTLCHRINVDSRREWSPALLLATLTHELGHEWEHLYGCPGKPPYHTQAFRRRMAAIGIPCTARGQLRGIEAPFVTFLRDLGVETETVRFKQEMEVTPSAGRSRLKKWSCQCTNIWAARPVSAICFQCACQFVRGG